MKKLMWWLAAAAFCVGGCIRVEVRDGTRTSSARVAAERARRSPQTHLQGARTLSISGLANSAAEPNLYEGQWTTGGAWPHPVRYAQFEVRDGDRSVRGYSVQIDDPLPWKALDKDSQNEAVHVRWERPGGILVLEGQRSSDTAGGRVTFEPNAVYVDELAKLVGARPEEDELLALFFHPVKLDYARQVKQVLADELTIESLLKLNNYHVSADYIEGSRDAGYTFSVEQLVRLANYRIPLEMLRGFRQAGYDFSVEQFIRIRNYRLEVLDFTEFRRAGYDFSIDEMIRAKNHRVPVEMARTLREAGLHYDLDQIIKLVNYHVSPEYLLAFQHAGYRLSVDDIIKAKNYHVQAGDAARLKALGYNFSLDDLIKLRNYNVSMEFMEQVHDPQYENFTAQELISFRQRNISAETINKIRTAKRKAQPDSH
jgi:hypothetical protein